MKIGILSESDYDSVALVEIVKKIASEIQPALVYEFLPPYEAGGVVIPKMPAAAAFFFTASQGVDIAVFGVDLDGQRTRKKQVNGFAASQRKINADRRIIPLFVEPHLEELFFSEGGNAIKSVLPRLDSTQPLPYSDMEAKTRLKRLIKDFGSKSLSITSKEVCAQIAQNLDIEQLARNHSDFKRFKEKLISEFRSV